MNAFVLAHSTFYKFVMILFFPVSLTKTNPLQPHSFIPTADLRYSTLRGRGSHSEKRTGKNRCCYGDKECVSGTVTKDKASSDNACTDQP